MTRPRSAGPASTERYALMTPVRDADEADMKGTNETPPDEPRELKPEMRELIFRFDAKDRRDPNVVKSNGGSKEKRRRGEKPSRAK